MLSTLISGCAAPSGLVVWATRPMIDGAMQALMSETDLEFAKSSFESNLKLIDGFLEMKPDDYQLLTIAAKGYAGYALIFLEEDSPERASYFYNRSLEYGLRALNVAGYDIHKSEQGFTEFSKELQTIKSKDINAVYWAAIAWAGKLNLNRDKIYAIAEFPRVLAMMKWVQDHDSEFFYSGPSWFLGVYYSSIPVMIGGNTDKAKEYFDEAIKIEGDNFLLGKVWMAEYHSVQTIDRKQFLSTLTEVVSSSQDGPAELRLINSFAKTKAANLLSKIDTIFE